MSGRRYVHQELDPKGVFVFAGVFGLASGFVWLVWGAPVGMPVFSIGGLYLLVARAPFMSLITELDSEALTVQYWLGLPRRRIPTERIISAEAVTNPKWARRGGPHRIWAEDLWSYSVWGVDAVEVRYRNDAGDVEAFRIGTDDGERLLEAIAAHGWR